MKVEEKNKAIELRKSGKSVKGIAKELNVSKSSVSLWVRDIELTDEQKLKLKLKPNVIFASKAIKEKFKKIRDGYRQEGREKAKNGNLLYAMGCMLYWAEGWHSNNRNSVSFSNSNVYMLKMFVKFLKENFEISEDKLSIYINCYTDLHSVEEIESYWLRELSLPKICLRKTIFDRRPECTKKKRNGILEWGTVKVSIGDVSIIQKIYGSIQEYAGFYDDNWNN